MQILRVVATEIVKKVSKGVATLHEWLIRSMPLDYFSQFLDQLTLQEITDFRQYLGVDQVSNTTDLNKPVSIATQNALNAQNNTGLFVAGVLRNDGSGWKLLSDGTHQAYGLASASNNDSDILVTLDVAANKVGSVIAVPDESFAGSLSVGSSVGLDEIRIRLKLTENQGGYCSYNGTDWSYINQSSRLPDPTLEWDNTAKTLKLTFPSGFTNTGFMAQATARGVTYRATIESSGDGVINVAFIDSSGNQAQSPDTNMKIRVYYPPETNKIVNPNDVTTTIWPSGNIWLLGMKHT